MTETPGTDVAQRQEGVIGLDDVNVGDVILPRITIVHAKGLFKDNLTNQEISELDCIILGLVKQRVFWASEVEDGDRPLCKSPDHKSGFPNVSDDVGKDKRFPWDKSNFDAANFPPGDHGVELPCASCIFKEWDKGDWKVPPCAEQHTYPILYNTTPGSSEPSWMPAIVTFQKTGIKPSKAYLSAFVQGRKPMFTARTRVTLTVMKRGSVEYSVPVFSKVADTDSSLWNNFGDQFLQIQSFLQQPPRGEDEEYVVEGGSDNTNTPAPTSAPAQAAGAPPAAPAPSAPPAAPAPSAPAPLAPDDTDGLPF